MDAEVDKGRVKTHNFLHTFPCKVVPLGVDVETKKKGRPRILTDFAHPRDGTEVNAKCACSSPPC